jgi:hypothetical protein
MEKTKHRLLGTAPDLGSIASIIGCYFYSNTPFELREGEKGIYSIHRPAGSTRPGQALTGFRVIVKGGRFRFEDVS